MKVTQLTGFKFAFFPVSCMNPGRLGKEWGLYINDSDSRVSICTDIEL